MTNSNALLTLAHQLVQSHLTSGAIALDATTGNGHDTLWLAQLVAPFGKVYGFDIQTNALNATRDRLQAANLLDIVDLTLDSHANLKAYIDLDLYAQFSAIMFNLGYLPGSDKTIVTHTDSTLSALNAALELLAPAGIITILAYPGHIGGDLETHAVENWCAQLDATSFQYTIHLSSEAKASAPRLLVIEKKSG